MRTYIIIGCAITAAFLAGLSTVVTKTVEVPGPTLTIIKDGPERIIHEPADTAELDKLREQLATAEAKRDANLKGWQDAYAAWEKSRKAAAVVQPTAEQGGSTRPMWGGSIFRRSR